MEFESFYRIISEFGGVIEDARELYDKFNLEEDPQNLVSSAIAYSYILGLYRGQGQNHHSANEAMSKWFE